MVGRLRVRAGRRMDTWILSDTLPKAVLQDTCIAVVQVFAQQLQYFFNTYVPWYVQYC